MGTDVHETMHSYGHNNFSTAFGFDMNEGATEYFARKVCAQEGITKRDEYDDETHLFTALVEYLESLDEAALADMYFKDNTDLLRTKLTAMTDEQFSYEAFLETVKGGSIFGSSD